MLPEKSYDLIVANILKNVLIAFADGLVSKLNPGGTLILSGLMEQDAFDVLEVYLKKRSWLDLELMHLGVWRCLALGSL